ncbi:MAG: metalloregulator ArsR/SmtB family transcription factor [Kiritimatiellae bacterium]|nr:metalloregulator ArsR/SmtB family transcription factor [Kiritimatiellia bacterium]MDD5522469.1 metalloregulator ArsR/SmtB family transcription factor [Kiritimatiellia bacterium]
MKTKKGRKCTGLSVELLARTAETLKLLAHPQRLKIVEILDVNGSSPVHIIAEQLDLPQAATSQHLNQMKRVGLINAERKGKEVWYSVGDPRALTILGCIRKSGGCS